MSRKPFVRPAIETVLKRHGYKDGGLVSPPRVTYDLQCRAGPFGFTNESITPPRPNLPHICLREGYWRVSPQSRPYYKTKLTWQKAHAWASWLNGGRKLQTLIEQMTAHQAQRPSRET